MSISKLKNLPASSGVYLFHRKKTPIYIGKAVNLKKRVSSYFRKKVGSKVKQMLQEATSLDWIETSSEIEAFLKEAELIKKYRPKYNVVLRDDKNYFYVGLMKEKFPRIFITHQPKYYSSSGVKRSREALNNKVSSRPRLNNNFIGPFTNGAALKIVLKLLRRVFPYCTCRIWHKRPCLNSQIGKCFGYCCRSNHPNPNRDEYQKNIKNVAGVLNGRSKKLIKALKKEMTVAAKNQEFEIAAKLRNQISGLENIFSHRLFLADDQKKNPLGHWPKIEKDLKIILSIKNNISRVEGYDISNILGQEATGSMVVFTEGQSAKVEYRKFRIKTVRGISDVNMLKEVVSRRLNHPEWSWPDLMLIDGGRAQLNAVLSVLKIKKFWPRIAVIALAKREEELYLPHRKFLLPLKNLPVALAQFLQRVRDESHRFARKYHHQLRKILFRG